jgi:hypothetical protein
LPKHIWKVPLMAIWLHPIIIRFSPLKRCECPSDCFCAGQRRFPLQSRPEGNGPKGGALPHWSVELGGNLLNWLNKSHKSTSGHPSGWAEQWETMGEADADPINHKQRVHLRHPVREWAGQFCKAKHFIYSFCCLQIPMLPIQSFFANAGTICNHVTNQWGIITGEQ